MPRYTSTQLPFSLAAALKFSLREEICSDLRLAQ
jgi:hypothetical protein